MKEFIQKNYGTNIKMAKELGVTNQTVTNWIKYNPRGMLKYIPEIIAKVDITERQLVWEIIYHENFLKDDNAVIV